MLEFATLLLGLAWGPQPIKLIVADQDIVRVELKLDGVVAARIEQEPWEATVDLGSLTPHRLEADGFDARGKLLSHAEQWLNVPRSQAEARLVIEDDGAGHKTHARLTWENVSGEDPTGVEIRFDGVTLEVTDPSRFALPPTNLAEPHFLVAKVSFPSSTVAQAEAVFGGRFGDEVETELTAFPLRVLARKPNKDSLHACFSDTEGKPLRVADIDREAAKVIFVRDVGMEKDIERLREMGNRMGVRGNLAGMRNPNRMRFEMLLEEKDQVQFVWPNLLPDKHPHFENMALFETSQMLTAEHGGLYHFLTRLYPEDPGGRQHLADAVALAGLRASSEGHRRAVVLVIGDDPVAENSVQSAASVRAFLETMQVPLVVWSSKKRGGKSGEWSKGWPLGSPGQVSYAVDELRKVLSSQLIVWLAGRHLPTQIQFDAARCKDYAPLFPQSGVKE